MRDALRREHDARSRPRCGLGQVGCGHGVSPAAFSGFASVAVQLFAGRLRRCCGGLRRLLRGVRLDAVLLDLARDEVALGDVDLFLLRVAGEFDDLHAVEQRAGDGVELVGGADEEHLREIERLVEVVVAEGVVLLGVERFEQRGRGVATEVAAELVDLVEHEDGVLHLDALEVLDDLAGQRADVGAAMAADLGLVVHAAERDAGELAAEGARDGAAERGFADARRSDEAEDRALHVGLEAAHGEVVEDAVLDLFEAVVILRRGSPWPS